MKTKLLKKLRNKARKNWRVTEGVIVETPIYYVEEFANYKWNTIASWSNKKQAIEFCKERIEFDAHVLCNRLRLKELESKRKIIYPAASE